MNVSPELAELRQSIDPALLGRRIKAARVGAGLTQTQMALPEASIAYLSRIESGDRRPDLKLLVRFAEKANVSLESLLVGVSHDQHTELTFELSCAAASISAGDGFDALQRIDRVKTSLSDSPTSDLWPQTRFLEACAHRLLGNFDEAVIGLEDLTRDGRSAPLWLRASVELAAAYLESDDPGRCIEIGTQVLDLLVERGLAQGAEAVATANAVVEAFLARGESDRAAEVADRVLGPGESLGFAALRDAYLAASLDAFQRSEVNLAASFAQSASQAADELQAAVTTALFEAKVGELLLSGAEPNHTEARKLLDRAASSITEHSLGSIEQARVQLFVARAHLLEGDLEAARAALPAEEALGDDRILQATRMLLLGQVQRRTRKLKEARETLSSAVTTLKKARADRATAQVWFDLGAMFDELGDNEASAEAYRQAARATGLTAGSSAQRSTRTKSRV